LILASWLCLGPLAIARVLRPVIHPPYLIEASTAGPLVQAVLEQSNNHYTKTGTKKLNFRDGRLGPRGPWARGGLEVERKLWMALDAMAASLAQIRTE
jgi:hypothetical protein